MVLHKLGPEMRKTEKTAKRDKMLSACSYVKILNVIFAANLSHKIFVVSFLDVKIIIFLVTRAQFKMIVALV